MASEVFIDTSGFYALLVNRDDMHKRSSATIAEGRRRKDRFLTTDYVLDETVTLLKARGYGHLVEPFLDRVFRSRVCSVEWMDAIRFETTCSFLLRHGDKAWSFTDCFSFYIMRQRKLRRALTKDDHFTQAGFHALLT